ncbi:MAG: ABC transporter substrate-binding protein [Candidatus Bathyarchaeota archaeon]|nr:ABC transporter substrate-binding protein [Candidatus Bathyarchaeota archaeon]
MQIQNKLVGSIIVVILVLAAVAVWQLAPKAPSAKARDIKVGLVAPLNTSIGQDMLRAAEMAVKEINDAGGVYVAEWKTQVKFTIVKANTNDDNPANVVKPVTRTVETDQVDLLIGGYSSAGTLVNQLIAIDNKVPYIITGASNQLVTRRGPQGNFGGFGPNDPNSISDAEGMSYMFHYCATNYHYSKTIVDFFATEMKPQVAPNRNFSLAILYRNDAFGQGVEQATKYWIQNESLPITLVAEISYETTIINVRNQLNTIAETHPDAVLVVDNPDKTPLIIKQGLEEAGLKTIYIAVENSQDLVFYDLLGKVGDGQLMESKFNPFMNPSYSQTVETYCQKYYKTYNQMPGMMGAGTYDAFYIAKDAIQRAGTVDKAKVRNALETTNMDEMLIQTKTGRIQFSTGVDYHEIDPVTFIEQLKWDNATSKLKSQIIWVPPDSCLSGLKDINS